MAFKLQLTNEEKTSILRICQSYWIKWQVEKQLKKTNILNWLEEDYSELELTDQEIVDMVMEPAAPDTADDIDAMWLQPVTAEDAFKALEVRLFLAHSNFISSFKLSNFSLFLRVFVKGFIIL